MYRAVSIVVTVVHNSVYVCNFSLVYGLYFSCVRLCVVNDFDDLVFLLYCMRSFMLLIHIEDFFVDWK